MGPGLRRDTTLSSSRSAFSLSHARLQSFCFHVKSLAVGWGLFFPSNALSSDDKRGLMTFKHTHRLTHTALNLKTQRGGVMGSWKHICHQKCSLSEEAGEVMNEPFITGASSLDMFPLRHKHSPGCLIVVGSFC